MTNIQTVHFAIELWGALFSIIAGISIFITRHFDKAGANKLLKLITTVALLLISDAVSWASRGASGQSAFYLVRIVNFTTFFFAFLIMPLVADYLTYVIKKRIGIAGLYWVNIEWGLFVLGVILLVINVFRPFMYDFDGNNAYFRLTFGVLPGIIGFIGIIITLGVVFAYIKYMNTFEKIATALYLILPIASVVVQIFHYGISLTYFAITVSTILLFVSYIFNYMQYNIELEHKLADERIRLVNQQIQPHFIFNCLTTIRYLCRENDEAVDTINEFAGYLRGCTDFLNENDCIEASREFELVRHYVYLEQRRFGDKISVEYDLADTDFKTPPFAVQTLVENAIKHGLRSSEIKNGLITISSKFENNSHIVEITDNGVGFDTKILKQESKTQVGIQNTQKRLALLCNGKMSVESEIGKGTRVIITIPAKVG